MKTDGTIDMEKSASGVCWQGRSLRGVIFDLDGVLISTDDHHFQSWSKAAAEWGLTLERTVYDEKLRGFGRQIAAETLLANLGHPRDEVTTEILAARKNAVFQDLVASSPPLAARGAAALLGWLTEHSLKLAVASSSRNARQLLALCGLSSYFDAVVDGNDAPGKPEPQVFLLAAKQLQVATENALIIEDAEVGVEAARRAGMAVVVVGSRLHREGGIHQFAGLDAIQAAFAAEARVS